MRSLAGFAQGMASGLEAGAARNERRRLADLQERYIDVMGSQGAGGGADMFYPGGSGPAGSGDYRPPARSLGPAAPSNPSIGPGGGPVPRSRNALTGPAGGPGQPGQAPASGLLFDLIDRTEGAGRYDTLFGHSQREGNRFAGVDVSRMTLGQLREFASPSGEYGRWVRDELARSGHNPRIATPMGRHQIVGTTLFDAADRLGLSDDTVFDRRTQDLIANDLARRAINRGGISGLRSEWEGFRSVPDHVLQQAIDDFMGQ
jgi:hypothetical protein